MSPYRVMTVCTGNICRSPMAEVVLRHRLAAAGLGEDAVVVDSTGTTDEERGRPMDPRARRVLEQHGYPAAGHRARQVRAADLGERDLVLAMTAAHAASLRRLARGDAAVADRVRMWRSFDPAAPTSGGEVALDVVDPWYGGAEDFEVTLADVEAAVDGVVDHIRRAIGDEPADASTGARGGAS